MRKIKNFRINTYPLRVLRWKACGRWTGTNYAICSGLLVSRASRIFPTCTHARMTSGRGEPTCHTRMRARRKIRLALRWLVRATITVTTTSTSDFHSSANFHYKSNSLPAISPEQQGQEESVASLWSLFFVARPSNRPWKGLVHASICSARPSARSAERSPESIGRY